MKIELKNIMVIERDKEGLLISVTKGFDYATASAMCRKSVTPIVEIHSPTQSFYREGTITAKKEKDGNWKRSWKAVPVEI